MDKKTTALLKLIYLEMFGYDMSWASFHVLEVMSSPKYLQKRVGYLGAVQSFRPDTEVLMLATNLLKKDIVSPLVPTMSLPLLTLPHIISPSLAMSLLSDLLPRLNHSHPAIRKKTVVNLYRLSLVYPEAFRLAWPKIKERLMDDEEDSSVTAAVINVVCELGWRRPHDFLPLAPRLFELLVDGGNNWMAIKIIKLFASLTPLEPRLVRKLLRPLINIIQSTSAMSLLYECINGVIQGGILDGAEGIKEGDEIANLCVDKLRGMIVLEGDPNLKYVALLAFNRIVASHPMLVSRQQDVILDCLDDSDISIRLQALELVSGMVSSDSLQTVVNRLITQLQTAPASSSNPTMSAPLLSEVAPSADFEGHDPEEQLQPTGKRQYTVPELPNHYRRQVLHRILDVCSRDNYANMVDFEWYVEVLLQLVKLVPASSQELGEDSGPKDDIAARIGSELRNVAVRVRSVRPEATRAAESLILVDHRRTLFPPSGTSALSILEPVSWLVGEYADCLQFPDETLSSLIHFSSLNLPARVLSSYLQAIPKLFVSLTSRYYHDWNSVRQNEVSLLLARITDFLDKLSSHPDLDVQERAIEFLELLRLTAEAVSTSDPQNGEMPLLISSAIPSLFSGLELNPVAAGAQRKVPLPEGLDLDTPLNIRLPHILDESEVGWPDPSEQDEFQRFYYVREPAPNGRYVQKESMTMDVLQPASYQNLSEDLQDSAEIIAKRRAERRERNKDDPFYIAMDDGSSGSSTPFHQVLRSSNGEELDIDSIPIIDLAINSNQKILPPSAEPDVLRPKPRSSRPRKKVEILGDENIEIEDSSAGTSVGPTSNNNVHKPSKGKKSLLEVDSSGLMNLSLDEDAGPAAMTVEAIARKEAEEAEMAKAMREIERLRLEMQRASERVQAAEGEPPEGDIVKRKKKKKKQQPSAESESAEPTVKKKKSKKSKDPEGATAEASATPEAEGEGVVVKKKKKKKKISAEKEEAAVSGEAA
ncbi:hypothetical protein VTO42DRAFT_2448 [Malbranchea cinnamomea]